MRGWDRDGVHRDKVLDIVTFVEDTCGGDIHMEYPNLSVGLEAVQRQC